MLPTHGQACTTPITSILWPAAISLLPRHLLHIGTILTAALVFVITVIRMARPMTVMAHLDASVREVEDKVYDLRNTNPTTKEITAIMIELKSVRLEACELRKATFRASSSTWKEFRAFCRGHSMRIIRCLRRVGELDILKAEEEQRRIKAGEFAG
ncbi:hypothetical protein LshimejAT787_1105140 [Lyophyllum shimeji]|uniref:Uncharacterized protein n=1 Tax=Lyophyllum shimeji TaxID=47721 RepID=A0A9P3PVU3_LYOSH|nr:hypothetical protein LshimejAT787_1105140 [Lyophyllum shimeji]